MVLLRIDNINIQYRYVNKGMQIKGVSQHLTFVFAEVCEGTYCAVCVVAQSQRDKSEDTHGNSHG